MMAERLFKPLGMKRTTLRPTMAMTWPLAQGHEGPPTGAPAPEEVVIVADPEGQPAYLFRGGRALRKARWTQPRRFRLPWRR
jgi:CubicO group peptidase (beta-lactamase class C family)